jgi:hypothetical protein
MQQPAELYPQVAREANPKDCKGQTQICFIAHGIASPDHGGNVSAVYCSALGLSYFLWAKNAIMFRGWRNCVLRTFSIAD